ncbi:MAG: 4Fe-4S cluster-binding domain-containing protein [Candidatus Nezhaarchaeales archaeon]
MKVTKYLSYYVGELPKGCKLCMKGMKLVYFVTGLCGRSCFYCPLSKDRRGRDVSYADEVLVSKIDDVICEAKAIEARGVGVTGGDPLLRVDRVVETLRVLKRALSKDLHVHLYTTTQPYVNEISLSKLLDIKVNELRFHPNLEVDDGLTPLKQAIDMGFEVGVEVPAIPGYEDRILKAIERARRLGASFVVINELEMTESNAMNLQMRGLRLKVGSVSAVEGSWETAMTLLKMVEDLSLNGHFCPAYIKDSAQFRNRLRRKARNIALPHEVVTKDPLLVKGVIEPPEEMSFEESLAILRSIAPGLYIYVNYHRNRVECNYKELKKLAKQLKNMGFKLSIVSELPTSFREQVMVKPI